MNRGEQGVSRDGLLEAQKVVNLGGLADVAHDLIELPTLGHPLEYLLHLFLRFGHVVRRDRQYGVVARLFLLAHGAAHPIEPLGERAPPLRCERQQEVSIGDLMVSRRTRESLQWPRT